MQSDVKNPETVDAPIGREGELSSGQSSIAEALLDQARQLIVLAMSIDPKLEWERVTGDAPLDHAVDTAPNKRRRSKASPDMGSLAMTSYRARRIRDKVFKDENLFGEPAWDMLLDLACAATTDTRISVSSACIGSCVPSTTGLRWLAILEKKGLVTREEDAFDKRRAYVRLSQLGLTRLKEYFTKVQTA